MNPILERYMWSGGEARRYWAIQGRILVGGGIVSAEDGYHLARDYGITHVLSAESENDDKGKWPTTMAGRFAFPDDGKAPGQFIIRAAVKWVRAQPQDAIWYTHCRLGGSRGPSMAYLVMRAHLGMSAIQALECAGVRQDGQPLHRAYIEAIEESLYP